MPTAEYMREYRLKKKKQAEARKKAKEKLDAKRGIVKKPPGKRGRPKGSVKNKPKPKRKPTTTPSKPLKKGASKGGGHRSKDAAITDNFNTDKNIKPTKDDMDRALAQAETAELEAEIEPHSDREPAISPDEEYILMGEYAENEDAKSAYAMLEDMRAVYQEVGGRERLMGMVNAGGVGGDKQFMALAKDLMKVELSILSATIRKSSLTKGVGGEGGGGQNFFVVLKGLENEKSLVDQLIGDKTVDISQIKAAINPDSRVIEMGNMESTVGKVGAPPEEIIAGPGSSYEPESADQDPFDERPAEKPIDPEIDPEWENWDE